MYLQPPETFCPRQLFFRFALTRRQLSRKTFVRKVGLTLAEQPIRTTSIVDGKYVQPFYEVDEGLQLAYTVPTSQR